MIAQGELTGRIREIREEALSFAEYNQEQRGPTYVTYDFGELADQLEELLRDLDGALYGRK